MSDKLKPYKLKQIKGYLLRHKTKGHLMEFSACYMPPKNVFTLLFSERYIAEEERNSHHDGNEYEIVEVYIDTRPQEKQLLDEETKTFLNSNFDSAENLINELKATINIFRTAFNRFGTPAKPSVEEK